MHEIQGTVLSVTGRKTRTGKTVYDIAFSDGQAYSTFNLALATQATEAGSQPVVAQVEVSQNGNYTNYNLIAIRLANGAALTPAASPVGLPLAPAISPIPVNTGGRGRDPEVEARIVRQSSMATAFNFVSAIFTGAGPEALDEAKGHAIELAKELFGHAMGKPAAAPQPTPTVPAEVAAQVNEVVGASAVAVGAQATPDW